jgi:hypothetical protein
MRKLLFGLLASYAARYVKQRLLRRRPLPRRMR